MNARPGAALICILAALSLSALPCAASGDGTVMPEVGRALLDEARQSAGIGDWDSAAAYLGEAALRDPGNSDILYLKALAAVKRGSPYAGALGDLDAALSASRFRLYEKVDARVLKAELLLRERRWSAALDALGGPGGGNGLYPGYALARARAFLGRGEPKAFLAEIRGGLQRFPDDSSFARLFIEKAGKLPQSKEAQDIGSTILGRLDGYAEADPELPVLAAPLMPGLEARRNAVLAFRAAGGSSPKATLRALEYGLIDEAAASAELLGEAPVRLEDLSALLALAGSPAGREAVRSALASWKGEILVDADSDGVYEERFDWDRGLVRGWSRDSKQEGLTDEKVNFVGGVPVEASLQREGRPILVEYSRYPAVARIAFGGSVSARYAFGPEAFSYAPIAFSTVAGTGRDSLLLPRATGAADPVDREAASVALSVETSEDGKRVVATLDRGLPVSSVTYLGDRVFSKRSYEKGRPVLELVDADGDGRFETEKTFSPAVGADGRWPVAWVRVDADGDGVYEYREEGKFPFLKEWDYDGNGSVDARTVTLSDGSVEGSYSSRLDGKLDEAIVVKDGRIVSVARDGAKLRIVPDAARGLSWLGRKPFDLGSSEPSGEGIFSAMGTRYRLTRIGDLAFAELIP